MAQLKSIGDALDEMLSVFAPVGTVRLDLIAARGLVAASDVIAQRQLPPFDNSAMDGYAVRSSDAARPRWSVPVVGESRAGGSWPAPLVPGTAMRIFTGAPVPEGADAVVVQENVARDGERVSSEAAVAKGSHIRTRGSDVRMGDTCVRAGTLLHPGEIGAIAAQGLASVEVVRRPRVAVVATGDELREIGEDLPAGAIVSTNSYTLAAAVASVGAEAWVLPIARDNEDHIVETLRHAFAADVVLCSGGVSVGEYDRVALALARLGVQERFHKVAMKPGKPLWFGMRSNTPFIGLPGNPVSAWVAFEVFVRPCLRKMLGQGAVHTRTIIGHLTHEWRRSTGRTELARARTTPRTGAAPDIQLLGQQSSGAQSSMVGVDTLAILPAECGHLAAGTPVTALVLHEALGVAASPFR